MQQILFSYSKSELVSGISKGADSLSDIRTFFFWIEVLVDLHQSISSGHVSVPASATFIAKIISHLALT